MDFNIGDEYLVCNVDGYGPFLHKPSKGEHYICITNFIGENIIRYEYFNTETKERCTDLGCAHEAVISTVFSKEKSDFENYIKKGKIKPIMPETNHLQPSPSRLSFLFK